MLHTLVRTIETLASARGRIGPRCCESKETTAAKLDRSEPKFDRIMTVSERLDDLCLVINFHDISLTRQIGRTMDATHEKPALSGVNSFYIGITSLSNVCDLLSARCSVENPRSPRPPRSRSFFAQDVVYGSWRAFRCLYCCRRSRNQHGSAAHFAVVIHFTSVPPSLVGCSMINLWERSLQKVASSK